MTPIEVCFYSCLLLLTLGNVLLTASLLIKEKRLDKKIDDTETALYDLNKANSAVLEYSLEEIEKLKKNVGSNKKVIGALLNITRTKKEKKE